MNILVLALIFAMASGKPQYNYQNPSGGAISPGGYGKPSNGKAPGGSSFPGQAGRPGGYNYNRPPNGVSPGRPSSPGGLGGDFGFPEGQAGPQGQITPDVNYNQPAIIHKNVYVHVPPPELEEGPAPQAPVKLGQPEKNYKIIFIKAPAPAQSQAPVIPVQPLKEEKTLVYVLVKKPEDAAQAIIPTPEPTQPSKPEVFFIRYKPVKGEGAPEGGYSKEPEGQTFPGQTQTGGQGFPSDQAGAQGYPSQQTGGQGNQVASYLPPKQGKPATGGSY